MCVASACQAVRRGGVIAYPTEGVFGLGCDPDCHSAIERIISIKGRESGKGLIIIASQSSQLHKYIAPLTDDVQTRLDESWPGPTTWIVPAKSGISSLLTGQRSTLAVRVSAHPIVRELCDTLGHGLISTSANYSGEPPLRTTASVRTRFGSAVDVVVDGVTGDQGKPTAIFDAMTLKQLR